MENYKIKVYDPFTLQPTDKETPFPEELVGRIESFLQNLNIENLKPTPMMIDPKNLDLYFGIIEQDVNGMKLKYRIILSETKN